MRKEKNKKDGKDKFRIKPYTPKYLNPSKNKKSLARLEQIKALSKNEPDNMLYKFLLDIAYKGANLDTVIKAVYQISDKWMEKTGTCNLMLKMNKGHGYIREEKAIRGAFRKLCELKIVLPTYNEGQLINAELVEMQSRLKPLLERYLDLLVIDMNFSELSYMLGCDHAKGDKNYLKVLLDIFPPKRVRSWLLKESKPLTQSTHRIWNESKETLFDEFIRIGFSIKSAKRMTAELLNLFFPDIYRDKDPELISTRNK